MAPHLVTAATPASGNNFRGRRGDAPKAYEPAGQEPKPPVPFVHFPFSQGWGSPTTGSFPEGRPLKFYEEAKEGLGAGVALVSLLLICPAGTGS